MAEHEREPEPLKIRSNESRALAADVLLPENRAEQGKREREAVIMIFWPISACANSAILTGQVSTDLMPGIWP
jgi:hypothetical protein